MTHRTDWRGQSRSRVCRLAAAIVQEREGSGPKYQDDIGVERSGGNWEEFTKRRLQVTGLIVGVQGAGDGLRGESPILVLKTEKGNTGREGKTYFGALSERRDSGCSACSQ